MSRYTTGRPRAVIEILRRLSSHGQYLSGAGAALPRRARHLDLTHMI